MALAVGAGSLGSGADLVVAHGLADSQPHWMQHLGLVVSQQVGSSSPIRGPTRTLALPRDS